MNDDEIMSNVIDPLPAMYSRFIPAFTADYTV
jgi:hypothetical protein